MGEVEKSGASWCVGHVVAQIIVHARIYTTDPLQAIVSERAADVHSNNIVAT